MGLHNRNPVVLAFWLQIICSLPSIGLFGNHKGISNLMFRVGAAIFMALGSIVFMMIYSFNSTRPIEGRTIFKLIESIYQSVCVFFYIIILGISASPSYLEGHALNNAIQIFASFTFASYVIGAFLSLTELIWDNNEVISEYRVRSNNAGNR